MASIAGYRRGRNVGAGMKRRFVRNFIKGAASVLVIYPASSGAYVTRSGGDVSDSAALAGDIRRVGADLRAGIELTSEKIKRVETQENSRRRAG